VKSTHTALAGHGHKGRKALHLKDDEMPFRLPADKVSLNGDFIRVLLVLNEVLSQ
jgi:hypothetical protein